MPATNVTSKWVSGNLVFYDKDGNVIVTYDGTNRKLTLPSGSTLESLGTNIIADATLSPNDLAVAQGSILVGDAAGKAVALDAKTTTRILVGDGTTIASVAMSGDVAMANTGVVSLANLGGADAIVKTETGTHTLVAAHATKTRECIVVATVTEAFATGTGTRTIITVGEADTPDKMWAATIFPNALAINTVIVGAFTNTATKAITATSTAAVGDGTGGVRITVLAVPIT